ncbi:Fur family transcriptional regulator [Dictyobacter alpinus]|uniref:Fur family transcriptional regulator n=1 Tax=Dictyobacter alpinus TaxID=2014873 RepID=UPI000F82E350|nr:transcriptional repressor [Dictyobacter alpinus]
MSKTSVTEQYDEEKSPAQFLLEVGLKVTYPRLLVLSLLLEIKGHYSADEIVKMLKERQTPLPRASVYNTLEALLDRELIMVGDVGPGRVLYEMNKYWHHHFVCMGCGMIIDIPCLKGEKPCLYPEGVPGTIEEAQIIFRGYCNACLARTRESKATLSETCESGPVLFIADENQ